jgi:Tfp pilus assembly protein PilF
MNILKRFARLDWMLTLLPFFLGIVVYANTAAHGFVYDDVFFNEIPEYRSLSGIVRAFQVSYVADSPANGSYRPIPASTFVLTYVLFGDSPLPFHITNILLHGIICSIIYIFLVKYLSVSKITAITTALLFAVLPVHTEVVANNKARDELFYVLFSLGVWISYLKAFAGKRRRMVWLFLAGVCYLLALLSKEYSILSPLIGIALALLLHRAQWKSIILSGIVFVPAFLGYFLLRYQAYGVNLVSEYSIAYTSNPLIHSSFFVRMLSAVSIYWTYIEKIFFPLNLSANYNYAHFVPVSYPFETLAFTAGFFVMIGSLIACVSMFRTKTPGFAGWIIFLLTYFPISQILRPGSDAIAERWIYFPSLGILLVVSSLALWMWKRQRIIYIVILGICCILYSFRTVDRNTVWASNESLYASILKDAPKSAYAHYLMGFEMLRQGKIQKAKEHAQAFIDIYPKGIRIYNLLATIAMLESRFDDAQMYLDKSLELNAEGIEPLRLYAAMYYKKGEYQKAYQYIQQVINIKQIYRFEDSFSYAAVLAKLGRYKEAELWLNKSLKKDQGKSQFLYLRAVLLYKSGRVEEAMTIIWDAKMSKEQRLYELETF